MYVVDVFVANNACILVNSGKVDHAAIGIHQMRRVQPNLARRDAIWETYNRAFADLPVELREQISAAAPLDWLEGLANETDRLIAAAPGSVYDRLGRDFERTLIRRALVSTGGRRIEAAQLLGIGRNTITRKIQELGLDD